MKRISFICLILLSSCSSIPTGVGVMKGDKDQDERTLQSIPILNLEKVGTQVQVVRSYARVDDKNIMNLEAVYIIPYQEKKINFKDIELVLEADYVKE